MINLYDKLVIGLVAVLAVISVPVSLWASTSTETGPPRAVVSVAGKEVLELDLTKDQDSIPVLGWSELCELEVKDGQVRVKHSTCKNKLCMRQGYVSGGKDIVCLPHKIVVETSGKPGGSASSSGLKGTAGSHDGHSGGAPAGASSELDALSF